MPAASNETWQTGAWDRPMIFVEWQKWVVVAAVQMISDVGLETCAVAVNIGGNGGREG